MSKSPRYIVKFANGAWVVFDTVQYRHATTRGLEAHAVAEAARRNAGGR